jgi:hypothetical protein
MTESPIAVTTPGRNPAVGGGRGGDVNGPSAEVVVVVEGAVVEGLAAWASTRLDVVPVAEPRPSAFAGAGARQAASVRRMTHAAAVLHGQAGRGADARGVDA